MQPRVRTESEEEPTPDLRDLLCYVTAARRSVTERCPYCHRNLMLMVWEPHLRKCSCKHYHWAPRPWELRKNTPGTGTSMWYITARGARHIQRQVLPLPACLHTRFRAGVGPFGERAALEGHCAHL